MYLSTSKIKVFKYAHHERCFLTLRGKPADSRQAWPTKFEELMFAPGGHIGHSQFQKLSASGILNHASRTS